MWISVLKLSIKSYLTHQRDMSIIRILLSIFLILSFSEGLDLPSYFTKCKKNDPLLSDCVLKNINETWHNFVKGDKMYHILTLEPLHIPYLYVKVDANLFGNMTNGQVDGMSTLQVKDLTFDLEKRRMDVRYLIPKTSIHGDYDVNGKVFGLPLNGQGVANVTFVQGMYHYYFEYDLFEKNGKEYIEITKSVLEYEDIERVYFNMNFLKNRLGEEINKALNENWRELNKEVSDSVGLAFGEVFKKILNEFFKKVPFDNFFNE